MLTKHVNQNLAVTVKLVRPINKEAELRLELGLRQLLNASMTEEFSYEIDFLHRTVHHFLSTPTVQVQLAAPNTDGFNANMTLARAYMARIKGIHYTSHPESNLRHYRI